jgi:ribosome-binding protein aMBF1 (putative translation factor)
MSFIRKHLNRKLKDENFKKAWKETELEYQIQRQIISRRKQKGFTQSELAKLLKTTQSTVARIENGNQNITIENLNRIAEALDRRQPLLDFFS